MTPAQIGVVFSVEPPDLRGQSGANRRKARQAELFEMVCLKHSYRADNLLSMNPADVANLVKEVDPTVQIDPAMLRAALEEWLNDRTTA